VTSPPNTDPLADPPADMGIERSTLVTITGAKSVANTALRWIPPFLPTLEVAFGASTTQLTTILGASELAGLSTLAVGDHLDRGRERVVMVTSLGLVTVSSLIALTGSLVSFAVAFVVLVLGVANYTVAGHAWISHRVVYRWRARAIGIFEISWALAMLIGAPIVAVLINRFGWRGPFVVLAVGSMVGAFVVARALPPSPLRRIASDPVSPVGADPAAELHPDGALSDLRRRPAMTARAWFVVSGSAFLALAGISVFVISGSWLSDSFDVSTSGIGVVAMGFGAVELIASTSIATFADRLGKLRSTIAGICVLLAGIGIMSAAGDRVGVGILGLLVFLLGFEYGFVTSLSLTSEAMPESRGATLAIGNAIGTLARATGIVLSGVLYGAFGIGGTAALSACAATGSLACYVLSRRPLAPAH
jgi:DHA1 family inner membrane transport protein